MLTTFRISIIYMLRAGNLLIEEKLGGLMRLIKMQASLVALNKSATVDGCKTCKLTRKFDESGGGAAAAGAFYTLHHSCTERLHFSTRILISIVVDKHSFLIKQLIKYFNYNCIATTRQTLPAPKKPCFAAF